MRKLIIRTSLATGLLTTLGMLMLGLGVEGIRAEMACAAPYRVSAGETLSAIAIRVGVPVAELARINHIHNPNRIRNGEVLCLPPTKRSSMAGAGSQTKTQNRATLATESSSPETIMSPTLTQPLGASFDLVAEFAFSGTLGSSDTGLIFSQDRIAGLRNRYPLAEGRIITAPTPLDVSNLGKADDARFWLARTNAAPPFTYTLVVISNTEPLINLQIEPQRPITALLPDLHTPVETQALLDEGICTFPGQRETSRPVTALLDTRFQGVQMRAELTGPDGSFIPITIKYIDFQPNVAMARICYPFVGFAVNRLGEATGDELALVLSEDGQAGIPGEQWKQRCRRWQNGGRWNRLLYRFYGCRN